MTLEQFIATPKPARFTKREILALFGDHLETTPGALGPIPEDAMVDCEEIDNGDGTKTFRFIAAFVEV